MTAGLWRDALRRLAGDRAAMAGLVLLVLLALAALAGPALVDWREDQID